jgi:glycosyltransferase involved in cell wall biosynthesis
MTFRTSDSNHKRAELMPEVTVLLTTYNRLNYLKKAIDSVLRQTFKDFDLIILDNASPDGTEEYVKSLRDERIKYIRNPENIGAINNGLKSFDLIRNNVKSEFTIMFHDDDMMKPDLLASEIEVFRSRRNVVLVATNAELIDENEKTIQKKALRRIGQDVIIEKHEYIEGFLKRKYAIFCTSVMIRRSFFVENDFRARSEIGPAADNFLWFEMNLLPYEFYIIHEPLLKYRIHNKQDTQIRGLEMLPPFFKGSLNLLKNNNLDYLFPFLKKYAESALINSLSIQRCLKRIDNKTLLKNIEELKRERVIGEKLDLKNNIFLFISLYMPNIFRFIYLLRRKIRRFI